MLRPVETGKLLVMVALGEASPGESEALAKGPGEHRGTSYAKGL